MPKAPTTIATSRRTLLGSAGAAALATIAAVPAMAAMAGPHPDAELLSLLNEMDECATATLAACGPTDLPTTLIDQRYSVIDEASEIQATTIAGLKAKASIILTQVDRLGCEHPEKLAMSLVQDILAGAVS
jgi:hypothetical protein